MIMKITLEDIRDHVCEAAGVLAADLRRSDHATPRGAISHIASGLGVCRKDVAKLLGRSADGERAIYRSFEAAMANSPNLRQWFALARHGLEKESQERRQAASPRLRRLLKAATPAQP